MQLIIYTGCAEPMLIMGSRRDVMWNDNWIVVIVDGGLSPQFEHSLFITELGVEILII
jgi:methionyl aminopeptidase